jgi:PGF-pre-PGF domain-containing protein
MTTPNPDVYCWNYTTEDECNNVTGCGWGSCWEKGCWNYWTEDDCLNGTGTTGESCAWHSDWNYCYEPSCWEYSGTNQSACENNPENISCKWVNNYYVSDSCEEPSCYHFDFTNQSTCENNTANLSCTWDGQYCMMEGCWNYNDQPTCNAQEGCSWKTSSGAGWCEEVQCWTWDSQKGGNESQCVNNTYNLSCAWENYTATEGWCYVNFTSTCSNITTERECMDTFYCWWQYNDWNDPSQGGNCKDPSDFGFSANDTIFEEWNPGCYVFDMNSTNCNKVLGCNYTNGACNVQTGHANENEINTNGINCTMINDSNLCNNIAVLSSCCEWKAGNCEQNKMSTSCRDRLDKSFDEIGIESCEDVSMKTSDAPSAQSLCEQIAGDPYYMPCDWDNSTKSCKFKSADIFGNRTKTCSFIDNQKTCEAAGCKWISENYCEGNISVPAGRCEKKGGDERNCNKVCFACEYKFDGSAHNSTQAAREYCYNSKLGYCEFIEDSSAPNGYGFCRAKEQFKKGIASDCTSDCGSCAYMGNPNASSYSDAAAGTSPTYDQCNTPKCYCEHAYEFNNVKCKWVNDTSSDTGGYCLDSSEKTCRDSCDRCYTKTDCVNKGREALNATGSCTWDNPNSETDGTCTKSGETSEVCWDAIDNDADDLIDCEDPECYADSFCGFVSGDCFGWSDQTTCEANGCSWMTDPWGSWCDFPGADCWKYDGNQTACQERNSTCEWSAGSGEGWCEQDWSLGEDCYNAMSEAACNAAGNCTWTNDTWCDGAGADDPWCQTQGGWCDPEMFAPKNCWQYDSNSSGCDAADGCMWQVNDWGASCDVDWSSSPQCWMYGANESYCTDNNCTWITDSQGGSWCGNKFDICWNSWNQTSCAEKSDCYWDEWSLSCQPLCFNQSLDQNTCTAITGCKWSEGWCMEDWSAGGVSCWDPQISSNQTLCINTTGCKWKNPGWCNPKGFAGGDAAAGTGVGASTGMECWKYDGNESACTNSSLIGMSCDWMTESRPFCEPDWSANCWDYNWNSTLCDQQPSCQWYNDSGSEWCGNLFDQCWSNSTLNSNNDSCNANPYCNWTTGFGGLGGGIGGFEAPPPGGSGGWCEPSCFSATDESSCGSGCRWLTGWCNPPGMNKMFEGMESGAPAMIAMDNCSETDIPAHVDVCGAGMKDMGDSFGIGAGVRDISMAGICNQEKIGFGNQFGNGNESTKYYVYLDSDGERTGGCKLPHNSSSEGYEFMFKYTATWNSSQNKAVEVFNAYRCSSNTWKAADITLNAWKAKMCSEIQGLMVAVKKSDLEKFPTLYDSEKDMRVFVSTADANHNSSSPSDTAGPGWVTPGAIDFKVEGFSQIDADVAVFEDIMMSGGFVKYEDCFNQIDDDNDNLVDCYDWDCEFAAPCAGIGVNNASYVDTTMPVLKGVKVEEYTDSALVMYSTSKPTNGTLVFWYNDSACAGDIYNYTMNATIYDAGILSSNVREYKMWHTAEIYNDGGVNSLNYSLQPDTDYYYKLKICDADGRCSTSQCTSLRTSPTTRCSYCNFVTIINAPAGWDVYYDLDQDGTYEHWQGHMCGPNAGMKTNYTSGRRANIKLNNSEGGALWFFNVTLTKTGLTYTTRNISGTNDLIFNDSLTDASGNTIGMVGMISETRDKIISNLHPETCRIAVPKGDTSCTELWHCDDSGSNCVNRTSEATAVGSTSTTCIWQIPYCEFSTWASGEPGTPSTSEETPTTSTGGGGGGGGTTTSATSETVKLASMSAGKTGYFTYTKEDDLGIQQIALTPKEALTNVMIQVKKESAKPANVSEPAGRVYSYLTITALNVKEENISSASIKFKVEKTWITNNSIDKATITMSRYKDGVWNKLSTYMLSENETYVYYKASTPGFSVFAITGETVKAAEAVAAAEEGLEKKEPPVTGEVAKEPSKGEVPIEKMPTPESSVVIITFLVIVAVAAIAIEIRQKRKKGKI